MNYTQILCQPCYFYSKKYLEIKPNLRRNLVTLDELEMLSDSIEIIKNPLEGFEPFTQLIKCLEEDKPEGFSVRGYYLVGEFDLKLLKKAVEKRLVGKRLKHPSFSDIPLCKAMENVAISWNDTHVLVEYGRSTKLIPRKSKGV